LAIALGVSHIVLGVPEPRPPEPIHLNPATAVAESVLLPGDPHRALAIASELLEDTKILNQRRGLWGYTGSAPGGGRVTVQATGMGGPSAAIVAEELVALGARTLLRIGTCGALEPGLALGDLLVVGTALPADGASRALGAAGPVAAHPALVTALAGAAGTEPVTVASTDLFYDPREGLSGEWRAAGAAAVEMEAAAILQVGRRRHVAAGCLLAVTDLLEGEPARIADDELHLIGIRLGEVALAALAGAAALR
jgi:uridine phosphorylase